MAGDVGLRSARDGREGWLRRDPGDKEWVRK